MPMRLCLGSPLHRPGHCLTPNGNRCPDCQHAHRPGTTERGYGWDYQQARAQAVVHATHCMTCGEEFTARNPPTGGHRIARRYGGSTHDGITAECARCNYGWRRTGS